MRKETGVKRYPFLEKIYAVVFSLMFILSFPNLEAKVVRGIVIDNATEKPVTGSVVMLFVGKTIYAGAITDSTGLFAFDNASLDRFYIRVKRIGYKEAVTGPLLMSKLDTIKILVRLDVEEIQMKEIVVEEKIIDESLAKEGFYERREKLTGHFLTHKELKGRVFNKSSELLQSLPAIRVLKRKIRREDGRMETVDFISSARSNDTAVNIYLDGIPFDNDGSIDNLNPYDIAAVEYYSSTANAPMAYGGAFRSGGVLLIWTKR